MFKNLYTVQQTSQYTKTSPEVIRFFIRSGKLKASKMGRKYLISDSDLQDFIESSETSTTGQESK